MSELAALLCQPASRVHQWICQGISGGLTLQARPARSAGATPGVKRWVKVVRYEDWAAFVREAMTPASRSRLRPSTLAAFRRVLTWPTLALVLLAGCQARTVEYRAPVPRVVECRWPAEEVRPAEPIDGPY